MDCAISEPVSRRNPTECRHARHAASRIAVVETSFGTTITGGWLGNCSREYEHPKEAFMCDYSLHVVASRSAKAGDNLVTASFPGTTTRGFAAVNEPLVAVCLLPGTELAFEKDVEWRRPFLGFLRKRRPCGRLARFRQLGLEHAAQHHDAVEFPNGQIILLTDLRPGQRATVLQLPVVARMGHDERTSKADVTIIDVEPARTYDLRHV
jgi:hypothetical protein